MEFTGRFTSDNANYIMTVSEDGPLWFKICQPASSMFPDTVCRGISRGEWQRLVKKRRYHLVTEDEETKIGGTNR